MSKYCIENSVHLNNFQPRGRTWVCHKGMTSLTRVAQIVFLHNGVYYGPHYRAAQDKSHFPSAHTTSIIIAFRMQYLANFLETCMVAGFHALGFNFIICFIGMLFIHSAQSYPTLEVRVLCS